MLTARGLVEQRVEGLDAGADDYLTKPFDPNELRSRLTVGVRILNLQNQLLRKEEELNFQAWHDSLTSLWNRGAIMGFLDSELARVHRTGCSVGVLMVDIDHFKKVNDVHGHPTGDAVLREVAQRLASCTRAYDWVGRYGGEEFMVVLSNCDPEAIATCAERLRATVAAGPVFAHGCELPITVSVGAALYSRELAERGADALALADAALYRAKAAGRNRVEMA
jgi:diguanylate cyclase (GGDEF)-like protein